MKQVKNYVDILKVIVDSDFEGVTEIIKTVKVVENYIQENYIEHRY